MLQWNLFFKKVVDAFKLYVKKSIGNKTNIVETNEIINRGYLVSKSFNYYN